MLDQINISMNDISYSERSLIEIEGKTLMAFYIEAVSEASKSIDYHTKENEEEIKRASDRTEWINKLRRSVGVS
jgi:hypothetical protein